jgi:hypothetical protein
MVVFVAGMIVLQLAAENLYQADETGDSEQLSGIQTFSFGDFRYGPQEWRPYNYPLHIDSSPGGGTESWYLMFVRLNGTPWGGNPNLERRRHLVVDYRFENLSGMAAFHMYGIREYSPNAVTNRQEGYGKSAYTVIGSDLPGIAASWAEVLPGFNNIKIGLSNLPALSPGSTGTEYMLEFNRGPTSGQDSIHFTTDLALRKGEVVTTSATEGSFYITHTGGRPLSDLLLMVAVNRTQPETFRLHISSEPEAEES